MSKKLYSIGEVAKLNNISIQTLRYYDKIGLFKPISIDLTSNYRYYHEKQFFYLDIIKYLKYIDTPLGLIKEVITKDAEEMLSFLEDQELVIDEKMSQLTKAKNLLGKRKLQIKEQNMLASKPQGQVFTRFVEEQDQLHVHTKDLTPYGNPDIYMRDLALLLETKDGSMIANFYGCIYEFKDYKDTWQIFYSSIYTSLFGGEKIPTEPKSNMIKKNISKGMYVCIIFKWSKSNYFQHYQMLYDYIIKNNIITEGPVYEVSLPNKYLSYEEDDFITELRIKKKEND